jgi:hypothetical protein
LEAPWWREVLLLFAQMFDTPQLLLSTIDEAAVSEESRKVLERMKIASAQDSLTKP